MKHTSPWKALIFIYFFMLVFALVFQGIPPVFGFIIASMGINHAQAGALMSFFGLPGIFISIPGGILADVYGSKKVGLFSLCITLAGTLLVAVGNSYGLLVLGRVISGIGALTIAIVAPQMISQWFGRKEIGTAMGIFNTAMPLGTILTLNIFGLWAAASGWRMPIIFTSFYSFLVILLFLFKFPVAPKAGRENSHERPDLKKSIYAVKETGLAVWLTSAIWMLYNASSISFLTFGSDYYKSVGFDSSYAGFLTSLLMIGALILSSFVGYLTDRYGKEEYLIIGGSIVLGIALLLVPRVAVNPLVLGILIGISAAFVPSPVFSLIPKLLPGEQIGLGYGILSTCLNVGVLVGPFLVGLLYDKTANYLPGFNLMGALSMMTAVIGFILIKLRKSKNKML